MQCQIEAYKNEVEIMKADRDKDKYSEEKETQIKALQHALVGMQQVRLTCLSHMGPDGNWLKQSKLSLALTLCRVGLNA